jgi:glutathione S-transferase
VPAETPNVKAPNHPAALLDSATQAPDAAASPPARLRDDQADPVSPGTPGRDPRIGCRDVTAIADFLADKPFMLGEHPSSLDATAHAFLANLLWAPVDSPIRRHAQARPTLDAYCRRMKARYYT